jgi:hypothetical protein
MNENKTKASQLSVIEFLDLYPNQKVIPDCKKLIAIFKEVTKCEPVMWSTMVGFDTYHYKYASGREGDYFITGFAPSKVGITLYSLSSYYGTIEETDKLGKIKAGKGCLYIKSLDDIDVDTLKIVIAKTVQKIKELYPDNKLDKK